MKNIVALATLATFAATTPPALAQASCSSDGATARPVAVFERFLSADCEACWADPATPAPSPRAAALVLDWIVPAARGDDAPLSAAASSDAPARLQALGRAAPESTDVHVATVAATPPRLRVAHGLPFNDYLGTSIAWAPARAAVPGSVDFVLLLVEQVPAGTEGTPVARNVVRNMLQGRWDERKQLSKTEHSHWLERRPMRIPEGARPERLALVGWVQDARGQVLAAAQSVCR